MFKKWSEEEESVLRKVYPNASKDLLQKIFPNRSPNAIYKKAFKMKLKSSNIETWQENELTELIRCWPTESKDKIKAKFPHRTWQGIKNKASVLGLKKEDEERPILTGGLSNIDKMIKGNIIRFGICSDKHLGSKFAQISYQKRFYQECEKEGVDFMIDAGDTTDGNGRHYTGQIFEMHIVGADELCDFTIKNYPKIKDRHGKICKTYGIAGYHDLDLWKYEGYDLLKRLSEKRGDYIYLGHASAVLEWRGRKIQIVHPSGGTAYAISYRLQKMVESFAPETKPHILIVGHYHKAEFIPLLRNVFTFAAGCYQAQTPFAIRKSLNFMYGGWIVEFGVDRTSITHMKAEFLPFYRPIENDYRRYEI